MIIEYFGVNGKREYDEQAEHKIDVYRKNGIEGLFLTDDSFKGDWPGRIMGGIEEILKKRLNKFYNGNTIEIDFFICLSSKLEVLLILK